MLYTLLTSRHATETYCYKLVQKNTEVFKCTTMNNRDSDYKKKNANI